MPEAEWITRLSMETDVYYHGAGGEFPDYRDDEERYRTYLDCGHNVGMKNIMNAAII